MARARLALASPAAGVVRAAWRAADGREPCGYLLGARGPDGELAIVEALVGRNVHPAPRTAFRLAPEEQLAVGARARARGLRVVGFWHGHLVGPPIPSRADREGVNEHAPGVMLIAGRAAPAPALEAWRRVEGAWRRWPLVVSGPA